MYSSAQYHPLENFNPLAERCLYEGHFQWPFLRILIRSLFEDHFQRAIRERLFTIVIFRGPFKELFQKDLLIGLNLGGLIWRLLFRVMPNSKRGDFGLCATGKGWLF